MAVGLRTLFPCWMSAEDPSQFLEASLVPWCMVPASIFKASSATESLMHVTSLSAVTSLTNHSASSSTFKDSRDYAGPTQMIPHFKVG